MLTWLTSTGVIAIVSVLGAGALVYAALWTERWWFARTATPIGVTGVSRVQAHGKLKGPLEAAGGTLRAPLADRDVLWLRVVVDELLAEDSWQEVAESTQGVPAVMREGEHAVQIDLAAARVHAVRGEHLKALDLAELTLAQREALAQMIDAPLPPAGRVREHVLAAGDDVVLVGTPRREPASGHAPVHLVAPLAIADDERALAHAWAEASVGGL